MQAISMRAFSEVVIPKLRPLADNLDAGMIDSVADTVCKLSKATSPLRTDSTPTELPGAILAPGGPPATRLGQLCAVAGLEFATFDSAGLLGASARALQVAAPLPPEARQQLYQGALSGLRAMAAVLGPVPIAQALLSSGAHAEAILSCVDENGMEVCGDLRGGFDGVCRVAREALKSNTTISAEDVLRTATALEAAAPGPPTRATVEALSGPSLSPDYLRGCLTAIAAMPSLRKVGHEPKLEDVADAAKACVNTLGQQAPEAACEGAVAFLERLSAGLQGDGYAAILRTSTPAHDRLVFLAYSGQW